MDLRVLERLPPLSRGSHADRSNGLCVMEAVAYVAREAHSDQPQCVCPVLGAFFRAWNDALASDADRDRLLKPWIPRLINTRSTPTVADRRAWLALDWLVRVYTPAWLVLLPDLQPYAQRLRALPAIRDLPTARQATLAARAAARATAWAAAWAAVEAAAARATAEAAVEAAAWAAVETAAWAAAGDAAWAAARAAVWAAAGAAAGDAAVLAPVVSQLQDSAAHLIDAMLAVTPESSAPA